MLERQQIPRRPDQEENRRANAGADAGERNSLLDLQRAAGNQAVSALVQRAPKDRPQTTDAPGAKAKPKKPGAKKTLADIRARVIGFRIDGDQGVITMSAGSEQGVKAGMSGSLVQADGKEYADFTIEKVLGATSVAHVKATQDQVSANPTVVIKASKFTDEDLSDKEF